MKKIIVIFCIFISIIFLVNCSTQLNIENTKWEYVINKQSISYFLFKSDLTYIEYDSEMGEYIYGSYRIEKNVITIMQEKGEFDDGFENNSKHKTEVKTYKMVIKNESELGLIENWNSKRWKKNFFYQLQPQ